jgi:hypothetical protein
MVLIKAWRSQSPMLASWSDKGKEMFKKRIILERETQRERERERESYLHRLIAMF